MYQNFQICAANATYPCFICVPNRSWGSAARCMMTRLHVADTWHAAVDPGALAEQAGDVGARG